MITINSYGTVTGGTIKSPGNIIQVVNTVELNMMQTSSTSYVDFTDATLNITPSSSSNKILVMFTCYWVNTLVSSSNVNCSFKSIRDSTNIYESFHSAESGSGGLQAKGNCNHIFVDSPSTASAITYKVQLKVSNSSSTVYAYDGRLQAFEIAV